MTVTKKWKDRNCNGGIMIVIVCHRREWENIFYLQLMIIFIGFDCWLAGWLAPKWHWILQTESCNLDLCKLSCAKIISYGIWWFVTSAVKCAHTSYGWILAVMLTALGDQPSQFFSFFLFFSSVLCESYFSAFSGLTSMNRTLTCRTAIFVPMDSFQLQLSCAQVIFNAYVIFHSTTTKIKWDKLWWTLLCHSQWAEPVHRRCAHAFCVLCSSAYAREPFRTWFNTLCATLIYAECIIIMQSLTHKLKILRQTSSLLNGA